MSKPETWKTWEGRQIDGKFPLRQWLGGTDHSAVFLSEIPGTPPQKVAIKLMPCDPGPTAESQVRSLRAKTGLSHRNLLQIFDAGRAQVDGECAVYAVMEYADDNLGQILPQRALEAAEVAEMLPPLLNALSYLHEKGLVHSRIRPSNILAVGEQLKLSSDQIRSAAEPKTAVKRDVFDAPELSLGGNVSTASDVWSLAMTLVAALTQKTSFAEQKLQKDPAIPTDVPDPYRGIAQASLRLDSEQRASIKQIEQRLKAPIPPEAAPQALIPATTAPAPIVVPEKKRSAFPITMGLAAVLAIVFAIFYFGGKKSAAPSSDNSAEQAANAAAPTPQPSDAPASAAKTPDSSGAVAHQVLPEVPQSARNTITGTIKVVVQTQVDASGKVTSAKLKSAGSSRYFAGLALKAAQGWQFSPPAADGQPTASTWLVQFHFRRTGTQASAQRSTR